MSAGKYEDYRVTIDKDFVYAVRTEYEHAQICAKFLINEISANEITDLLAIKADFVQIYAEIFSGLVLLENLSTEQFCALYVALWSLNKSEYFKNSKAHPVSLRLDEDLINRILHEIFADRAIGEYGKGEAFCNMYNEYPVGCRLEGLVAECCFAIFADLWSRATNQVIPLDLLLLTN